MGYYSLTALGRDYGTEQCPPCDCVHPAGMLCGPGQPWSPFPSNNILAPMVATDECEDVLWGHTQYRAVPN